MMKSVHIWVIFQKSKFPTTVLAFQWKIHLKLYLRKCLNFSKYPAQVSQTKNWDAKQQ